MIDDNRIKPMIAAPRDGTAIIGIQENFYLKPMRFHEGGWDDLDGDDCGSVDGQFLAWMAMPADLEDALMRYHKENPIVR